MAALVASLAPLVSASTEGDAPSVTWLTHVINNSCVMLVFYAIDHLLLKPWIKTQTKPKDVTIARWFFMHAIANALVCITCLGSLAAAITDPLNAMNSEVHTDRSAFGAASVWPLTIINCIHVYHMVGGFNLSSADYFHHMLFIPLLGFPGQVLKWGAVENFGAFFISGLPGGLNYLMLGLYKIGLCGARAEKRISANLNTWVRTPGIIISTTLVYQGWLYGKHQVPFWPIVLLHVVLPPFNALYYGKQAVANYSIHYLTNLLKQDKVLSERMEALAAKPSIGPVDGGYREMAWKEAISVPQRGS